ncbi:MAG TPA: hypothetical protein PKE55_13160, partial [Kiritimatiellia bacterium]|nr:hypothetical protein [Kiritimatiellia bacterium]
MNNADEANEVAGGEGAEKGERLAAGLYVIGTPIGNLGDITLRGGATLRGVGLVLAEDTRMTK